jgi:hypothetical protein
MLNYQRVILLIWGSWYFEEPFVDLYSLLRENLKYLSRKVTEFDVRDTNG